MKCLNCNKELPDDFLFCDECGTPVQKLYEQATQETITTSTDPSMEATSNFQQDCNCQTEPAFQQNSNSQIEPALQQDNNSQVEPAFQQDNDTPFHPDAQQTDNMQFDLNSQPINNAQFEPNSQQIDNMQFDPNAQSYNNTQFDPNTQIPPQGTANNTMQPGIKLGTKGIVAIAVVFLAIIAAIAATITFSNRKTTISLNDYVSVEYEGYDGYGTADVSLDWEGLGSKFAEITGVEDSDDLEVLSDSMVLYEMIDSINYHLDKYDSLSNGDTVTLTWSYDNEIAGKYKIEFEGEEEAFTVSNLKEIKEIDPFEDLEVTFSGTSPYAMVSLEITSKDEIYNYVFFDVSKDDNLTDGEAITITLDTYDNEEYFLSEYGCKFSQTSKEYTCENVDCYVMSAEDITDDLLETMKKRTKTAVANYKSSIRSYVTISNVTYEGYYLLTLKDTENNYWEDTNKCYVIYSATVKSKHKEFKQSTVYFPVEYSDLIHCADGTSNIDTDYVSIEGESGLEYGWWSEVSGYKKLTTLKKKLITNQKELYDTYASKELE